MSENKCQFCGGAVVTHGTLAECADNQNHIRLSNGVWFDLTETPMTTEQHGKWPRGKWNLNPEPQPKY